MKHALMRRAEKLTDWAISSEAPNRGTFNDYPRRGSRRKPKRQASRTDEDIVFPVVKAMGTRAADAIYKEGLHWKRIQGDECTDTLYKVGTPDSVTKQGSPFTGTAFSKVEVRTYKKRGDEVKNVYKAGTQTWERGTLFTGTAFYANGTEYTAPLYTSGGRITPISGSAMTLYYSDGDETVTVGTEEYTAPLYAAGTEFPYTKQGEMYEGELYYPGTEYSGGLYTNFELAQLTTKDVTALTV